MTSSTKGLWVAQALPDFLSVIACAEKALKEKLLADRCAELEKLRDAGKSFSITDRLRLGHVYATHLDAQSRYVSFEFSHKNEPRQMYVFYDYPDEAAFDGKHVLVSIGDWGSNEALIKTVLQALGTTFGGQMHYKETDLSEDPWETLATGAPRAMPIDQAPPPEPSHIQRPQPSRF